MCGSFAGMAKVPVVPTLYSSLLLGLVCAAVLIYFDSKQWLVGKGGRLGLIAQCACTLQFLFFRYGKALLKMNRGVQGRLGSVARTAALVDWSLYKGLFVSSQTEHLARIMLECVTGALVMRLVAYVMSRLFRSRRLSNPVGAVGLTGLIASLTLGPTAAGSAYAGSFVAMSSWATLPGIFSLVLASALAGVSQLGLTGMLVGGWGGKLGTTAFLGVLMYTIPQKIISTIFDVSRKTISKMFGKNEVERGAKEPKWYEEKMWYDPQ